MAVWRRGGDIDLFNAVCGVSCSVWRRSGDINFITRNCLEFIAQLGVAVATTPKGSLPPASPWNPTEPQLSENMNNHF